MPEDHLSSLSKSIWTYSADINLYKKTNIKIVSLNDFTPLFYDIILYFKQLRNLSLTLQTLDSFSRN